MLEAMRSPPVKSGETMASAPTRFSFSMLRTSWQRATTRTPGFICLAVSVISRFLPSSSVTAKTPAARCTPAFLRTSSSEPSPCREGASG